MKGFGIPYKKMKRYFQKNIFQKFRIFKKLGSYLYKISCSSLIINRRIVIRVPDERAWHPLQENDAIFSTNIYFFNFWQNFRKISFLLATSVLLAVEGYFAYQVKGIDVLYKKTKCYFEKKGCRKI